MKKAIAYSAILLAAVLASACKKDNTEETVPSLKGLTIEESAVPYVAPGTVVKFKADVSDIYSSDSEKEPGDIGVYWVVFRDNMTFLRDTLTRNIKLSNPEFSFTADEIGKYSVNCYAYAKGFSNASATESFSAIDPDSSLAGLEGETTVIDGRKFYTTEINGTTWLASNLYGTESGISYYLSSVTDAFLGKYYTWLEATEACPEGWKLPTAEEWDSLGEDACSLMTDATLLEEKMWTYWPGMDITNSKLFNAIPAGYVDLTGGWDNIQGFMDYAIFWTASDSDNPDFAQFRYIYADQPKVQKGVGSRHSLALSVRCIKK
ncbi:MAG: fibrobacter succinogenes major paralogous domain-containing protein [Bacteroidales bacterium]|nr:fibrobacter succinogenes major paralogous domain-containing protein [Bacteroidales bacterium]